MPLSALWKEPTKVCLKQRTRRHLANSQSESLITNTPQAMPAMVRSQSGTVEAPSGKQIDVTTHTNAEVEQRLTEGEWSRETLEELYAAEKAHKDRKGAKEAIEQAIQETGEAGAESPESDASEIREWYSENPERIARIAGYNPENVDDVITRGAKKVSHALLQEARDMDRAEAHKVMLGECQADGCERYAQDWHSDTCDQCDLSDDSPEGGNGAQPVDMSDMDKFEKVRYLQEEMGWTKEEIQNHL